MWIVSISWQKHVELRHAVHLQMDGLPLRLFHSVRRGGEGEEALPNSRSVARSSKSPTQIRNSEPEFLILKTFLQNCGWELDLLW